MNGPSVYTIGIAGSATVAVGVGAIVYTDAKRLDGLDTFALSYQAVCTGVPNVKIEMEQGIVKPSGNVADTNFVVPETVSEINVALTDSLLHHQAIFPIGVPYIRLKITELSGVATDTVLTINLSVQNRF